jgi:ankyrin repeat protein
MSELPAEDLDSPARAGSTESVNRPAPRLAPADLVNAPAVAWTPLHLAAHAGDLKQVLALLASGSAVDERAVPPDGCVGATPLHCAVASRSLQAIAALLAAGADRDARDETGYTPLLLAAEIGDLRVVRLLLRAGADPRRELMDESPLQAARRAGHHQVVALLRQVTGQRTLRRW